MTLIILTLQLWISDLEFLNWLIKVFVLKGSEGEEEKKKKKKKKKDKKKKKSKPKKKKKKKVRN